MLCDHTDQMQCDNCMNDSYEFPMVDAIGYMNIDPEFKKQLDRIEEKLNKLLKVKNNE